MKEYCDVLPYLHDILDTHEGVTLWCVAMTDLFGSKKLDRKKVKNICSIGKMGQSYLDLKTKTISMSEEKEKILNSDRDRASFINDLKVFVNKITKLLSRKSGSACEQLCDLFSVPSERDKNSLSGVTPHCIQYADAQVGTERSQQGATSPSPPPMPPSSDSLSPSRSTAQPNASNQATEAANRSRHRS